MAVAHQSSVVLSIALVGTTERGPAAEQCVEVMSEALGEEHPDGEALARGRIVVARGVTHEEHATLRDRAGALVELRRTERTRDEFRLA